MLARPGGHRDAAYLADAIRRQGISTLHFVPTMLAVFLQEESLAGCTSLRRVVASGEALGYELVERVLPPPAAGRAVQPLRPHGGGRGRHALDLRGGRPAAGGAHRPAHRQHPDLRPGPAPGGPCRWACRASCTWAAWAWRGATSSTPS